MVWFYILLLLVLIIPLLYTVFVYCKKTIKKIKELIKKIRVLIDKIRVLIKKLKETNLKTLLKIMKHFLQRKLIKIIKEIKNLLNKNMLLNDWKKWRIYLILISLVIFLLLKSLSINLSNNLFSLIFGYIILFFIFYGIGLYIHISVGDAIFKLMFYFVKLSVILIYLLSFFQNYVSDLNNIKMLFIIVVISITYSLVFIKNVIDSFTSYLFQFVNFVIIIGLNFVVIGITFGFFYLNNFYQYPDYFTESDYNWLINSNDLKDLFYVIYKGSIPLFNYPSEVSKSNGTMSFIPLIENFIGYIFNLLVVGFFVSYSVSKLIERRKSTKNSI